MLARELNELRGKIREEVEDDVVHVTGLPQNQDIGTVRTRGRKIVDVDIDPEFRRTTGKDTPPEDARSRGELWTRPTQFGTSRLVIEWDEGAPITNLDPRSLEPIEGAIIEQAQGQIIPINRIDPDEQIGFVEVIGVENARIVDISIIEFPGQDIRRREDEGEDDVDEDDDGDGQRGLNDIAAEVGTTEDIGRPGDTEEVREAIERWRDDIPPDGIGGWELIPKEERRGNYTFLAWKAPNRPLRLSLEAPIRPTSNEWGVVVSDGRISGFSSVPISGSSPADDRRTYPSRRAAGVAAIRWMSTHPADRYQHPFFDSRIADPPDGWRNESWRLEQRIEEWVFQPSREAVEDTAPVPKIEVEGFHGGDSYKMTQMPVGLPEADPDGGYPARGETLPRSRMLDEVTRFMEENKPDLQDLDRTPGPTFFDPPESSQIQHHAMRNDLHLVLSSAGIDRPTVRTLLEEFDDVNEFVDWPGDFQVFEGVGPATRERLNEIVELIERRDVDIGSGL